MAVFQIILICVLGAGALVSLGFTIAFLVEAYSKPKEEVVQSNEKTEEVTEIDLDQMLAKLEQASKHEPKEEEKVEEEKKEPAEEVKVEEQVEEAPAAEVIQEPVVSEEKVEEEKVEEEKPATTIIINNTISAEKPGPEFDYRIRLEKIKESQARIDRDLDKTTRAILKYERTIRRKERNQKMLDRRALELTNLNLLMYSVTDIKNVDAEKKARQEELTAHIAELKASIQDADNYLEANKEKHESNLKLRDYLSHEKARYADEVKELEALIASGKYFDDSVTGTDGENK